MKSFWDCKYLDYDKGDHNEGTKVITWCTHENHLKMPCEMELTNYCNEHEKIRYVPSEREG